MVRNSSIPQLEGGLPFLGHAFQFWRNPVRLLQRGRDRFGDLFSFRLVGKQVYMMSGPKANEAFLRASDDQLSPRDAYRFTVPIFGKGIAYDAEPHVMDEQLGFVFPALRDERLQAYAAFMKDEAERYTANWADEGEIDLLAMTNELTVFIATRCLIGNEFRNKLTTEFARLYQDLEAGINLVAFYRPDFPLPAMRRRDRARAKMCNLISEIIGTRRRNCHGGEDFLEVLMNARYSDGSALNDDGITGMLLTLIFAGQHTSAVLTAWTGILLAQHPEYIARVRAEVDEVIGDGTEITLAQTRRLLVLERCIKEAERMHPPLIMLMRAIMRDFEYDGVWMPAGGLAMVSPAVSHRIPEVFTNPDKYDPERFALGREEDRKSQYALIGFGGGKHRCIGSTFAYLQIKVIWTVLLRTFDFGLVGRDPLPDYSTFVVGPHRPCTLRYRRKRSVRSVRISA
jgi:sterol 14alpha-demethylase